MRNAASLCMLLVLYTYSFSPIATGLSWGFRDLFRSTPSLSKNQTPSPTSVLLISHRAASDPHEDGLFDDSPWYDTDGTPLLYNAWLVKPGPISPEPTLQSQVIKYGARVACWPSSGGVWIKHAELVDLDFLGLDRFSNTPRQVNQTEEDHFCTKLKMVGAQWWRLPVSFEERQHLGKAQFACDTLEECLQPAIPWDYLIAWPEDELVACYVPIAQTMAKPLADRNLHYNARTMEDRCYVIIGLGGGGDMV